MVSIMAIKHYLRQYVVQQLQIPQQSGDILSSNRLLEGNLAAQTVAYRVDDVRGCEAMSDAVEKNFA